MIEIRVRANSGVGHAYLNAFSVLLRVRCRAGQEPPPAERAAIRYRWKIDRLTIGDRSCNDIPGSVRGLDEGYGGRPDVRIVSPHGCAARVCRRDALRSRFPGASRGCEVDGRARPCRRLAGRGYVKRDLRALARVQWRRSEERRVG